MADYWIKTYHEILDDPKMATLPDRLWRRFMEMCLLAGRLNKQGLLPSVKLIAWALRISPDDCELDLNQLATTGMIERVADGWLVVNFEKRQSANTAVERKRQERDRSHRDQYYENVTKLSRSVTQNRSDTEQIQITDTDREAEQIDKNTSTDPFDIIQGWLEEATGILAQNNKDVDTIRDLVALGISKEDVVAGCEWHTQNKGNIRFLSSVKGPITTAKSIRIQGQSGKASKLDVNAIADSLAREAANVRYGRAS